MLTFQPLPALAFYLLLGQAPPPVASPDPATLDTRLPVTFRGVGPIRVGLGVTRLQQVSGVPFTVEPEMSKGCTYAYPRGTSQTIAFMIIDGIVARTDVEAPGFRTLSGAQVGDSEDHVKSLYTGRFQVQPHAYSDGHYITVTSSDKRFALVFETDGRVVTSFHVGRFPEVLWVEGCS